jgi:hypothetical protein
MGYVIIFATGVTMMLSHRHLDLVYSTVGWPVGPGHVSAEDAARIAVAVEEEAEHVQAREMARAWDELAEQEEDPLGDPDAMQTYHIRDVPAGTDAPTMYAFAELAARGPFEVRLPPCP